MDMIGLVDEWYYDDIEHYIDSLKIIWKIINILTMNGMKLVAEKYE